MNIYRNLLTETEQNFILQLAANTTFKQCPSWLGNFQFKCYYNNSFLNKSSCRELFEKLALQVPNQEFNTVFLQKYPVGSIVKQHRDPKNNIGYTIIAISGIFTGATTTVNKTSYQLQSGDVGILPCTINETQGPPHCVSEVTSGLRVALILDTIK